MRTRYVTVDLVVKGDGDTENLSRFLESKDYFVQKHEWDDENKWYLNISCPMSFENPDFCIRRYCEDLSLLAGKAKDEWEQAGFREFSIGYHVGDEPPCFTNRVNFDTVMRVSGLKAGIEIVLYPAPNDNE